MTRKYSVFYLYNIRRYFVKKRKEPVLYFKIGSLLLTDTDVKRVGTAIFDLSH